MSEREKALWDAVCRDMTDKRFRELEIQSDDPMEILYQVSAHTFTENGIQVPFKDLSSNVVLSDADTKLLLEVLENPPEFPEDMKLAIKQFRARYGF